MLTGRPFWGREEIGAAVRDIECSAQSEQGITNVPATATVPKFLTLQPLAVADTQTPCENGFVQGTLLTITS